MRIALTVDPEIPVPPAQYGGIERIVDVLARGLVLRGHDVTLFANGASTTAGMLSPYPGATSRGKRDLVRNTWHVSSAVLTGRYDVVHSFGRLGYLLPVLPSPIPKVMSYQRAISPRSVAWGERLSRGTLHFVGCSRWLVDRWAGRPNWHVVYNAAPASAFTFMPSVPDDAPLVFLGRLEEIKGPHIAVQVALRSRLPLVLAGNVPTEARGYFQECIEPYLDGERIRYVGPVDDRQKSALLGRSRALLMPVLWDEPFGIVMAEALACGTPVIGFRRGAVPEVIADGVTGYVCDSVEDMVVAVGRLSIVDRQDCREAMETRFSETALLSGYERVYSAAQRS